MNYTQLLEEVKSEVLGFFELRFDPGYTYHNQAHTESVVAHAAEIARHYNLGDRDYFIVITAAWFHDTGYYLGEARGHEQLGSNLAAEFLRSREVDEDTISQVQTCIMATCMPQQPVGLLQQIVCDADLYHWGTKDFPENNRRMRKEAGWRHGKKISKPDWRRDTIRLLESHQYQTDYARDLLEHTKLENIEEMKIRESERLEELQREREKELQHEHEKKEKNAHHGHKHQGGHDHKNEEDRNEESSPSPKVKQSEKAGVRQYSSFPTLVAVSGKGKTPDIKPKKEKTERPERGIETMFRISSGNHQRLSDMADNKAHIMITTTSIIISVLLSVLLRKLEDNPHLVIPTLLLLLVCLTTMVFCILATRPAIPDGRFSADDITSKKVNLLFFGNFYRMHFEEFDEGMKAMMKDRDFLYGSLTRDVFSQGVVLGRKYRLLRIGYNVFMFGVITSVVGFIIAVTLYGGH